MEVKDNASRGLADNQWHSVEVHHRHGDEDGVDDVVDDDDHGDDDVVDNDDEDQALFKRC